MQRLVIVLVGRKGSGKGTAAKIFKEKYEASMYRFSDILRDILDILAIDKSRENLVRLSEVIRNGFRQDSLQHALIHRLKDDPSKLIVLDGARRTADLDGLEKIGDVRVVSIEAPLEMRFERLRARGENAGEATRTLESFKDMEHAATEVTIADVEARADIHIDNSGDRKALEEQIGSFMKS